jgi:signal transduction histidine kinase
VYMRCGLVRIERSDVQRWWADPNVKLQPRVFDVFDGLRAGLATPFERGAVRDRDGRLWFANGSVVQMVDPAHVVRNFTPPPVHLEQIIADHKLYLPGGGVRLPARTRDVEIDYTALSFTVPQKVGFRYRLEGRDPDWQDAGTRRQAFYTNLSPGQYRFRVIARNNDGVWNETGASWAFSIAPTFYETLWFKTLMAVAGIGLIWLVYRIRLQQITARTDLRHTERLEERTRIARDLHDTLLQSFHGLMLRLHVVNKLLPEGKAKEQLEKTLERADQAIAEGIRVVYDLRSSATATNELSEAVNAVGNELSTDNDAAFDLVVEGPPRDLRPIIRDELYRISREALGNAFRHARAHRIEAEISYGERVFRLRIRDDGEGIPAEILEQGRPGHYGLAGIRERARKVGADLAIWSRAGTGTEIELNLAGSIAYSTSPRRSLFRLLRKKVG